MLNAVVYNRGSEALVRGLSEICKDFYKDSSITLVSSEYEFSDKTVNIAYIDVYQKKIPKKENFIQKYIYKVLEKIGLAKFGYRFKYKELLKCAQKQDIIIVIGADNYDIRYGGRNGQNRFSILNQLLSEKTNAKMILYDCSFNKEDVTDILLKNFSNFDYVTVREVISLNYLRGKLPENKLFYFPDPAFIMKPQKVDAYSKIFANDVVGINVSNLITEKKYGSDANLILNAYHKMIKYILDKTAMSIILVPHVMNNNDLSTLKILYSEYVDNPRVELITNEKLNAQQLKYIISKCRFYVGARTHSTIAAYSSYVPTLVLGYSIKSRGIAKDLFGTEDKYVLPVSNLDNDNYLVDGFKWLMKNEDKIKKILEEKIPGYCQKVREISEVLKKCEGNKND